MRFSTIGPQGGATDSHRRQSRMLAGVKGVFVLLAKLLSYVTNRMALKRI